ncbi:hypothetical protein [Streptomyces sp. NPDC007905]|uniref:hypothetical protein n=1 Tax=Streptomyces sp. NPDC007905 TaxID=3364788 RepID=UPI0036EF9565
MNEKTVGEGTDEVPREVLLDGDPADWLRTLGENTSSEQIGDAWFELFPHDDAAARRGYRVLLSTLSQADGVAQQRGGDLDYRPGGWTVDLSKGAANTAVAAAVLAGILAFFGIGLATGVVPAVVPLLFDLRKVRLTRSQRQVLAELTLTPEARTGGMTASELYATLPDQVRNELSRIDFEDLLENFHLAGVADLEDDGTVRMRSLGEARFRRTVR